MKVLCANGVIEDLDALACTYTYDGSGNMTAKVWTDGTRTWTMTFTYTANVLTASSAVSRLT